MDGIRITVGGNKLIFSTTGDVAVDTGAAEPQASGKWNANVLNNQFEYTLNGAAQPALNAVYSFNGTNQLVAKLKSGATTSAAFTFVGRIELDRNNDIVYVLVDRVNGVVKDTGPRLLLDVQEKDGYSLEPKTNNLKIVLKTGESIKISGETPEQALEASSNHDADFDADDLLMYQAITTNTVGGAALRQRAKLNFPGSWDIDNGQLVFVAKASNDSQKPTVAIGFAGRFKAVTAGFVYFADKTTKRIALNIRGQHVFKSDDSVTHLDWETSIGFTGKSFRAKVDVDLKRTTATGGILDLKGTLTLAQEKGGNLDLELALQARYQFNERNVLVFSANIVSGDRPAYDLMLTGEFLYSNLQFTFAIHFTSDAASGKRLLAELGIQGSRDSMIKMISLVLDISEQEAKLKINLSFSVRLRFVNGVRVKDEPEALPAGGQAGGAGA